MSLMPFPMPKAPLTFQSAFSHVLNANGSIGGSAITLLMKIYPTQLRIGTSIIPVLAPPLTGSYTITAARFGFVSGSSSSAVSYDGAQVPLTFNGGQASVTRAAGAGDLMADELAFTIPDLTKPVIAAFNLNANGTFPERSSLGGTNFIRFTKTGSDAATTSKSGYSSASGRLSIIRQLLIGS